MKLGIFCKISLLSLSLVAASLTINHVRASEPCGFFCSGIPDSDQVLKSLGRPELKKFPRGTIRALVWNIEKGENQPFDATFKRLAAGRDLVMVEEIRQDPTVENTLTSLAGFGWNEAVSFLMKDGIGTGVAIGSRVRPTSVNFLRSAGREPVIDTPKVSLLTEYPLAGRQDTLLAIVIHALNFTSDEAFEDQILDVIYKITQHKGPVLFAGDFNTHNDNRLKALQIYMRNQGLQSAPWDNQGNHPLVGRQLDHAFTRGLKVSKAHFINEVVNVASDHPAMELEFQAE